MRVAENVTQHTYTIRKSRGQRARVSAQTAGAQQLGPSVQETEIRKVMLRRKSAVNMPCKATALLTT